MNYTKIYDSLIERAKDRVLVKYSEKHHIIPVCRKGSNSKTNLVRLTAKEHYLAHHLLIKIYPMNIGIYHAFWMMSNRFKVNSKDYEIAKLFISKKMRINVGTKEAIAKMSLSKRGQTPWIGKTHTKESKIKMSNSAKDRVISEDNETKRRNSISKTSKKPKSKQHRENISLAKKGNKNPMFGTKWKLINGKRIYIP
ncbi:MAG: hypothetical protein KKD44_26795 [Proteobacteria bacterium]|nr:hypothetical protein [Pseudomonadota bacterium]